MFHKVLFSRSGVGTTAGLIVNSETVNPRDPVAVSKLFPWADARFMRVLHVSPPFATREDAFAFIFPIDIEGNFLKAADRKRATARFDAVIEHAEGW